MRLSPGSRQWKSGDGFASPLPHHPLRREATRMQGTPNRCPSKIALLCQFFYRKYWSPWDTSRETPVCPAGCPRDTWPVSQWFFSSLCALEGLLQDDMPASKAARCSRGQCSGNLGCQRCTFPALQAVGYGQGFFSQAQQGGGKTSSKQDEIQKSEKEGVEWHSRRKPPKNPPETLHNSWEFWWIRFWNFRWSCLGWSPTTKAAPSSNSGLSSATIPGTFPEHRRTSGGQF